MDNPIALNAADLNADAGTATLDLAALEAAMLAQGAPFYEAVSVDHPHLFAAGPVFISPAQLRKMYEVISASRFLARVIRCDGRLFQ